MARDCDLCDGDTYVWVTGHKSYEKEERMTKDEKHEANLSKNHKSYGTRGGSYVRCPRCM